MCACQFVRTQSCTDLARAWRSFDGYVPGLTRRLRTTRFLRDDSPSDPQGNGVTGLRAPTSPFTRHSSFILHLPFCAGFALTVAPAFIRGSLFSRCHAQRVSRANSRLLILDSGRRGQKDTYLAKTDEFFTPWLELPLQTTGPPLPSRGKRTSRGPSSLHPPPAFI